MTTYLVPFGYGEAEFIEKRSRFIGRVWPVSGEAEALARVNETRSKHRDATHNVYAYIIRENAVMRYSDDGEPGGTSGIPTLNVFRNEEIFNVCCVITRYFGGVLLGAGGLARAYSNTAKLALDAAGISMMARWRQLLISCSYGRYAPVKRLLEDFDAVVETADFGADVVIEALLREDRADEFTAKLMDITAGTAVIEQAGECFRGVRIR